MTDPNLLFGRLGNRMFQMAYIYAQACRGEVSDIYLQDHKYFDEFKEQIRALYGQGITPIDKVAIHVRRGDYVNNSFYCDLTLTNYYQEAMREFIDQEFLVFSDDIEWCKKQEIFFGCEVSEGNDEITDLNLMAGCKGIIMANSSFSWWPAYLSTDAKVICPKMWYSDNITRTHVPDQWIKM